MPPRYGTSRTILVVDDEEAVRKLTSLVLERAGYTVLQASGGLQALAQFRTHPSAIDLLVSDIEMRDMSGVALASQIREELPGMRVLLTSATPSYSEQTRFPFLAKPFTPDQLKATVAILLANPPQAVRNLRSLRLADPASAQKSRWQWRPSSVPVWAAAALLLIFIPLALYQINRIQTGKPDVINLQAMRGLTEEATARRSLVLNMDVSSLPRFDSYAIELVTGGGEIIWRKTVAAQASMVHAVSEGLKSGMYFIRVYTPAGKLLREYGLRVVGR
jgi:CheY-like chemotaxis protein